MTQHKTIAALATPAGVGAMAVVRMSGPEAVNIIKKIFLPGGKRMFPLPSHFLCHGIITDENKQVIDEVMCTCMYAPRSYTKEDVVEIYCHGGINTVSEILLLLNKEGARPAEPGEFTKRAFLNGRIDLSQAEAVIELINAKNNMVRRAGLRKLSGGLSEKIKNSRDQILKWLAHIELSIDYPEHEEEVMNLKMVETESLDLLKKLTNLRNTAVYGKIISTGVSTVISGKPNVGKSSLMNLILQENRAIVTDVPGTTRDTLTEATMTGKVPIMLTDTAGIRENTDTVEKMGVNRSKEQIKHADLVLHVIDRSRPLTEEDYSVAALSESQKKIVVLNKCDLQKHDFSEDEIYSLCQNKNRDEIAPYVEISAKTGEGLSKLYDLIETMFFNGEISTDGDIITRERHMFLLDTSIGHLLKAVDDIKNGIPEDIISIDLNVVYTALGEIIGEAVGDDILDRIFSEFCVGK